MREQNYKLKLRINEIEVEVGGDKQFVESKFKELKEKYIDYDDKQTKAKMPKTNLKKGESCNDGRATSIIEFVNSKKPKSTATEIMPVLVYYFKYYDKREQFNEGDIKNLYRRYDISKRPKNIYQAILDINRNKAYFESVPKAKGYFRLTEAGEHFVETKLPRNN